MKTVRFILFSRHSLRNQITMFFKKRMTSLPVLFLLIFLSGCRHEMDIKVLQFNIWQEGTVVEGGFEAIAAEINHSDADFVFLSEVRNYNNSRFCDRIISALQEHGKTYYSFFSDDSGLLSRFPLTDSLTVFPLHDDRGSIYKGVTKIKNREIAIYTAHLDYRNCAYYDVRGYDGSTWQKRNPVTNPDSILYLNRLSQRGKAMKLFLTDAEKERQAGRLIFFGGDFNEPSHLDWSEASKDMYDHHGAIVAWDLSSMLINAGYRDVYRELFPDPVTHPGFTFPSDNEKMDVSRLTWAPDADERERIDFIYFYPDKKLKPLNAWIIGPASSIAFSQRTPDPGMDQFLLPLEVWPTDHKAVLAQFRLRF